MTKKCFVITGGLGKTIASTVLFNGGKDVVVAAWPDVFLNHPSVECYPLGGDVYRALTKYDWVQVEPYHLLAFREGRIHLTQAFLKAVGRDADARPSLFLSKQEEEWAVKYLSQFDKPVILFQPYSASMRTDGVDEGQVRSLSRGQALEVAKFLSLFGSVLVLRSLRQPHLPGFTHPDLPVRQVLALVKFADKVVGVDSWLCHASAAFAKPGFFIFMSTSPSQLSYPIHKNFQTQAQCPLQPCRRPWPGVPDSFVCPFGRACSEIDFDRLFPQLERYLN